MGPKDVVVNKEAQAPSFQMVFHAPSGASPDFPPLAILDLVLLNGESSRLYKRLVRDEQLALSVSGGTQESIDPLLFIIEPKPRPGADLDKLEAVILEEIEKVKTGGITEREFQKAQNTIKSGFYFGMQSINGKAGGLGQAEILHGSYEYLFGEMDLYAKVTLDQVKAVAAKYLTENNRTIGKLIPEGGEK